MPYEDFTTYSETDAENHISVTSARLLTITNVDREDVAEIYKDKGANFFTGDFEHDFTIDIDVYAAFTHFQTFWGLTDDGNYNNNDQDTNNEGYGFCVYQNHAGNIKYFLLADFSTDNDSSATEPIVDSYTIKVERIDDTLTAKIYGDTGMTQLWETLTCSCNGSDNFQYIIAYAAPNGAAGNADFDGKMRNLFLHPASTPASGWSTGSYFRIVNDDSTNSVQFEIITGISTSHTKTVNTYVFSDDTDVILDEGKSIDQLTITGVDEDTFTQVFPVGTIYGRMNIVNQLMDDQEVVTLSGLDDYYMNDDYLIKDFSFNTRVGNPYVYEFTITFERISDRLPYSEI